MDNDGKANDSKYNSKKEFNRNFISCFTSDCVTNIPTHTACLPQPTNQKYAFVMN